ncbi:telomere repeat-binding protein 2 isoform X2 [Phoenix dactylifera]|uniref:Telomere repeat-binding protein 2 isoform X2 n=1 Tax=Phoenix dactylifera TaxID=42345 RepID=A0A8B9A2X5_PHODC|nr:telomere repeat-binding protein 2 isoform X2 [Phoenix dactylifera]
MVFKKRLEYSFNGYHVPAMPQIPKSAKRKRSVRRKVVDGQMCAFDLLAAVAGKILERENSSTLHSILGNSNQNVKQGQLEEEKQLDEKKLCQDEAFDQVRSNGSKEALGYSLGTTAKNCCTESYSPGSAESCEAEFMDGIKTRFVSEQHEAEAAVVKNIQHSWSSDNPVELDAKPPALASSDSSIEVPLHGHHIPRISSFLICRDDTELIVDRDDDENSSGCTHPRTITSKALKPQYHKIRKLFSKTDLDMKPAFHSLKFCYTRRRTQRYSFKRKKVFEHRSMSLSDGGTSSKGLCNSSEKEINYKTNNLHAALHGGNGTSSPASGQMSSYKSENFHVKLSIKSFNVPELFIEISETATVGLLKRTIMEAATAILGGGLRVGVLLQGKKVRDDNKTLLQAGISNVDKLDNLGFMLEPKSAGASSPVTSPEYPHTHCPCDAIEPLARHPAASPAPVTEIFNASPEPPVTSALHFPESDHDSVHSPVDTKLVNKPAAAAATSNSRALVPVPAMSIDAVSMVPLHKPRRSEFVQRRIRRPFSVSEVEALVEAVEKLGTGRWRDVKLQAFDNAKHRTYVDMKDKWKTLVHTAKISPRQRRGEPVPQELLDRVLAAHGYWSQRQAKLQVKPPLADACMLV